MALISYGVTSEEKAELEAYARAKGLKDTATLARFAVARYVAQYPLGRKEQAKVQKRRDNATGVPRCDAGANLEEDSDCDESA